MAEPASATPSAEGASRADSGVIPEPTVIVRMKENATPAQPGPGLAGTVVEALMRVQLDTDVPVFSAVLTPHHFHEHEEHRAYFARHFEVKGAELADAIAATLNLEVAA